MSVSRTYTVVLEPMAEGGYLVRVPALPEPEVLTIGDTEGQALEMARDAIGLVLDSRRGRGEDIPGDLGPPAVREVTVILAA